MGIGNSIVLDHVAVNYPIYGGNTRNLQTYLWNVVWNRHGERQDNGIKVVRALKDISLGIERGTSLGLIGMNGAGKTTLLKLMAGVLEPSRGHIERNGNINALLNIGSGMETDLSGYENIRRVGLLRGFSPAEIEDMTPGIVEFADIGKFMTLPVRTYSSGMRMRLSFAIATSGTPDVLLIDEVFNAGDSAFRARASKRIRDLVFRSKTFVLSSHSTELIREFCSTCLYLERGTVKDYGATDGVMKTYEVDIKKKGS